MYSYVKSYQIKKAHVVEYIILFTEYGKETSKNLMNT